MLRGVFSRLIALFVLSLAASSTSLIAQSPDASPPSPKDAAGSKPAAKPKSAAKPKPAAKPKSTRARLSKKVSVDLQGVTLEEALTKLREESKDPKVENDPGLKLYVDPVGLEKAKVTMQSKVDLVLSDVPLSTALKMLLGPLNLGYTVRSNLVVVTSRGR